MSEKAAQAEQKTDGELVLTTGRKADQTMYWAYIFMPHEKHTEFMKIKDEGNLNLADYGQIIAHGEGIEPPEEVKQAIRDNFPVNENT